MKNKISLELIGPCSDTGASINLDDTIVTIDDRDRIRIHQVIGIENPGHGVFTVIVNGGRKFLSSECWLLYTKKRPNAEWVFNNLLSEGSRTR